MRQFDVGDALLLQIAAIAEAYFASVLDGVVWLVIARGDQIALRIVFVGCRLLSDTGAEVAIITLVQLQIGLER